MEVMRAPVRAAFVVAVATAACLFHAPSATAAPDAAPSAETIAEARDTFLTDGQARASYEGQLMQLKPRFDLYEKAHRVNDFPWLADLVISRASKSPRILRRMSAVLEEQGNPGNLFSVRGFLRLFVPIP